MRILRNKKAMPIGRQGFTFIELLIVLAILAILMLLLIFAYRTQIAKGRDAKRKSDLRKLQTTFEDYYNDNDCYPTVICGERLDPYLDTPIPCDPLNNEIYRYYFETDPDCGWYRIYARLEYEQDPVIADVGCSSGCGPGGSSDYNYGVSSSDVELEAAEAEATPTPTEAPTPTPTPCVERYACQGGYCNDFIVPPSCEPRFCEPTCGGGCLNQGGTTPNCQ